MCRASVMRALLFTLLGYRQPWKVSDALHARHAHVHALFGFIRVIETSLNLFGSGGYVSRRGRRCQLRHVMSRGKKVNHPRSAIYLLAAVQGCDIIRPLRYT